MDQENVVFLILLLHETFDAHYHANKIITTKMWSMLKHVDLIDPIPKDEYAVGNVHNCIIC